MRRSATALSGLVATAALGLCSLPQRQVPLQKSEPTDSFVGYSIGKLNLTRYFDGEYGMAGNAYFGPPVVLLEDLGSLGKGTRVVPISLCFIVTHDGNYLGNVSWMEYKAVDTSEAIQGRAHYHNPEVQAEVIIYPKNDVSWGEVASRADVGLHSIVAEIK